MLAPPPADARYSGSDPGDAVRVDLDGTGTAVAVRLDEQWRRSVAPEALGPAVLAAVTAAGVARLTAWSARSTAEHAPGPATRTDTPVAPVVSGPRRQATRQDLETVARAWRDLREFALRLAELYAAPRSVHSTGRQVAVTVRGGNLVGIEVEQRWAGSARDSEIEHLLADTISRAFAAVSALPDQALDGCPDLQEVIRQHQPGSGPPAHRCPAGTPGYVGGAR